MDVLQEMPVIGSPEPPVVETAPQLLRKRKSQLRLIAERFMRNRVALAGLCFLVVMGLMAIFAPLLSGQTLTYNPAIDPNPAIKFSPSEPGHWLGTDDIGRDELARLLFGGRISLTVGLLTMLVAMLVGVSIGAMSGFYGGWVDNAMMRFTDGVLSVPLYIVLLVLSAVILQYTHGDNSVQYTILLIAFFEWAGVARVVRGEFLSLKEREFVLAARTLGARDWRLIALHILPNAIGPIMVAATLIVGDAIIVESILSFFGFGVQLPIPTWGNLLADSQSYITLDPLLTYLPGIAILVTVLSFNLVGDGFRDALDPHLTQR